MTIHEARVESLILHKRLSVGFFDRVSFLLAAVVRRIVDAVASHISTIALGKERRLVYDSSLKGYVFPLLMHSVLALRDKEGKSGELTFKSFGSQHCVVQIDFTVAEPEAEFSRLMNENSILVSESSSDGAIFVANEELPVVIFEGKSSLDCAFQQTFMQSLHVLAEKGRTLHVVVQQEAIVVYRHEVQMRSRKLTYCDGRKEFFLASGQRHSQGI